MKPKTNSKRVGSHVFADGVHRTNVGCPGSPVRRLSSRSLDSRQATITTNTVITPMAGICNVTNGFQFVFSGPLDTDED